MESAESQPGRIFVKKNTQKLVRETGVLSGVSFDFMIIFAGAP